MSTSKSALGIEPAVKGDEEQVLSPSTVTVVHKTEAGDESTGSGFWGIGKHGTYMSFLVLVIGIVISIIMQRYSPSQINLSSWENGCPEGYEDSCKANSAVLRISFALSILFALQMLGSLVFAKFYDILWVPKVVVLICVVIGFYFARSEIFGLGGYGWFARITGFLYLILQQIILLDLAYSWNEQWVEYSTEDGEKGKRWLVGILLFSAMFYIGSFVFIGIMYWQFDGCTDNVVIISITLALPILATLLQTFFTDEGSILTSAIMTAYATYVCYSSVSLNPNPSCNPTIASSYQTVSTVCAVNITFFVSHQAFIMHYSYRQVVGLVILVISLVWTTYNSGTITIFYIEIRFPVFVSIIQTFFCSLTL